MKKTSKTFLILILILPLLSSTISFGTTPSTTIEYKINTVNYQSSGYIQIYGNQDFNDTAEAEGWSGSGTEANPYVISGLHGFIITISNRYT